GDGEPFPEMGQRRRIPTQIARDHPQAAPNRCLLGLIPCGLDNLQGLLESSGSFLVATQVLARSPQALQDAQPPGTFPSLLPQGQALLIAGQGSMEIPELLTVEVRHRGQDGPLLLPVS